MNGQVVPQMISDSSGKMKALLRWLLLLSIALIPVWHFGEVKAILYKVADYDQATLYTPIFVSIAKNLLLPIMVLVSFLISCSKENRLSPVGMAVLFFMMAMLLLAVLMTPDMDIWKFMSGIRWVLPFFLMVLIIPGVDENMVRQLAYVAIAIAGVNLAMQLWQLGHMNTWWGVFPGTHLSARTPGVFPLPSPSAMFVCFSLLFSFLVFKDARVRWGLGVLGFVSVFLTESGTGFCVMLIILLTLAAGVRWRIWIPFIVPASYFLTKAIMPLFRGVHYFSRSLGPRTEIFSNLAEGGAGASFPGGESFGSFVAGVLKWFFGAHFGSGTNLAALLHGNFGIDIIPMATDSLMNQLIVNLGRVGLLFYLVVMAAAMLFAYLSSSRTTVLWLLAIGVFSVTVTITEAFPIFLLIVVAMAYSIKRGSFHFRGTVSNGNSIIR